MTVNEPHGLLTFAPKQRGMTLIEVLVTLLLISVGLLGVAALQLTSLRSNQTAYVRSQASTLAGDILDRMRANQQGVLAGEYTSDTALNGLGTAGTTARLDLTAWQAAIDAALPGDPADKGGALQRNGNVVTVTIRWGERAEAATALAAQFVTFQTNTEI